MHLRGGACVMCSATAYTDAACCFFAGLCCTALGWARLLSMDDWWCGRRCRSRHAPAMPPHHLCFTASTPNPSGAKPINLFDLSPYGLPVSVW